jgi:ribosomal protein L9
VNTENSNQSSVKITSTAKGASVEVKVYGIDLDGDSGGVPLLTELKTLGEHAVEVKLHTEKIIRNNGGKVQGDE